VENSRVRGPFVGRGLLVDVSLGQDYSSRQQSCSKEKDAMLHEIIFLNNVAKIQHLSELTASFFVNHR
jgi:hypothetical protein